MSSVEKNVAVVAVDNHQLVVKVPVVDRRDRSSVRGCGT